MRIDHVRKVSIGFKRKYRLFTDDGNGRPGLATGYAEKRLTVADEFHLFRDETRERVLAVVSESSEGIVAALTGYEVRDADGAVLGTFAVMMGKSFARSTWRFDQLGLGRLVGTERSVATARGRRLVGLVGGAAGQVLNSVIPYHFDFRRDDEIVFSVEKPRLLDDWYRLVVHDEAVDPVLVAALAIVIESRSR